MDIISYHQQGGIKQPANNPLTNYEIGAGLAARINLMKSRLPAVRELARKCRLCPRNCGVDRLAGTLGTCKVGYGPVLSSVNLHFGEEPPISGTGGSGTIFLTGCNLRCLFCQNYPISQLRNGNVMTTDELAGRMLWLQQRGAHNINLVTPTHQAAALFESLLIAFQRGLNIPIVYNSGGYESLEMLQLWDGIIDIYMPDAKYASNINAKIISGADDYLEHNRLALNEMFRQVGNLVVDENGIAVRGLLIRHLVLPENMSNSEEVLAWIANEISPDVYISVMSQYFPAWKGTEHPILNRRLYRKEYRRVREALVKLNMRNGWVQPF